IGGGTAPPPRDSKVFEEVTPQNGNLVIRLVDQPVVESRADIEGVSGSGSGSSMTLSPVGVADAKGRGGGGYGAAGRGSGGTTRAPRGRNGYHVYHGATGDEDYEDWEQQHSDEVQKYNAMVLNVGIARIGSPLDDEDDLPGAGPVDWDTTKTSTSEPIKYDLSRSGWYRVGTKLGVDSRNTSHIFGWESVDVLIEKDGGSYQAEEKWKVSPRL
ncbi:MAG: hypothetical protein SXQ77_00275, partial [Halobacteria archaeon]|nr:hypothetical protein [Halobacteria archaeon]